MWKPQPLAVASLPMPSTVSPCVTPLMFKSPLASVVMPRCSSPILPIILTQSGLVAPFFSLYPSFKILSKPVTVTPPTSSDTLEKLASVTYSTIAPSRRVPSILYAPEAVALEVLFTNA